MDAGRWTIPASRMKAGREFTVPLSTGAQGVGRVAARVPVADGEAAAGEGVA